MLGSGDDEGLVTTSAMQLSWASQHSQDGTQVMVEVCGSLSLLNYCTVTKDDLLLVTIEASTDVQDGITCARIGNPVRHGAMSR